MSDIKVTSGSAVHKASGVRFNYAVKVSWQKKYYTCEMNPEVSDESAPWFTSLSRAFRHAVEHNYLEPSKEVA
jgi:hypothetical protein